MAKFREYMDKSHELFDNAKTLAMQADALSKNGQTKNANDLRAQSKKLIKEARRVAILAQELPDAPVSLKAKPKNHKYSGVADTLYQNIIGSGAVDTPGERIGAFVKDAAHAGLAGAARGTAEMAGLVGTASDAFDAAATGGLNMASRAFGGKGNLKRPPGSMFSGEKLVEGLGKATGGATDYVGKNFVSRSIGTAGEFLPGVLAFEGGSLPAMAKYAALPGVASEAAGSATHGTAAEPYARLAASILAPMIFSKAVQLGARSVSPNVIQDKQRLKYLQNLRKNGIYPTAGQATGNTKLQYREAVQDFGKNSEIENQRRFTAAAMKQIGSKSESATPEALSAAYDRIGGVFNKIAKGESVAISKDGLTKAKLAIRDFHDSVAPSGRATLPIKVYEKINNAYSNSQNISGSDYIQWVSRLGKLTKSSDQSVRDVAIRLRGVLDGEFEKTLRATGKMNKVAELQTARLQYRNFLAIERAASGAGQGTAFGVLSPQRLRSAVNNVFGRRNYTQAQDGLPMLARSGTAIMKQLPQSGTAPRLSALANISAGGAPLGAGGLTYMATGNPSLALGVGAASTLYPIARNMFIGSRIGQRYLSNQLLKSYPRGVSLSGLAAQIPADASQFSMGK